ncbi:hypothetical protein, partial [Neisseria macacae]|uniref:hypothetical protein n=1 Tax=Neisseria macacae TaxID=496 RepID=UPI000586A065
PSPAGRGDRLVGSPKFGGNFKRIKFLYPYPLLYKKRHAVSFDFAGVSINISLWLIALSLTLSRGERG